MEFNLGEFRLWFNVCVGWMDKKGRRYNTVHHGDDDKYAVIWPDAYSNFSGHHLKGARLNR